MLNKIKIKVVVGYNMDDFVNNNISVFVYTWRPFGRRTGIRLTVPQHQVIGRMKGVKNIRKLAIQNQELRGDNRPFLERLLNIN